MFPTPKIARTIFASVLFFLTLPSVAEPPNLALLFETVKAYHRSGEYEKEISQVTNAARKYLVKRVMINQRQAHPKKLAIVLDIDETSLSNYNKMLARQFLADKKQLHQENMQADSPAIQPTLSLYQEAMKLGVSVFFVTGRPESERQATIKNLKKIGYRQWSGLYLRPSHDRQSSIIPFKSKTRSAISRKGYTIIASIGDQCSDLKGGYTEHGFKLPNPFYYLP